MNLEFLNKFFVIGSFKILDSLENFFDKINLINLKLKNNNINFILKVNITLLKRNIFVFNKIKEELNIPFLLEIIYFQLKYSSFSGNIPFSVEIFPFQ